MVHWFPFSHSLLSWFMDSTGLPTNICPCQSVPLPPFFSAYLFFCCSHISPVCASNIDQLLTALRSDYHTWRPTLKVAQDSRLGLLLSPGFYLKEPGASISVSTGTNSSEQDLFSWMLIILLSISERGWSFRHCVCWTIGREAAALDSCSDSRFFSL